MRQFEEGNRKGILKQEIKDVSIVLTLELCALESMY